MSLTGLVCAFYWHDEDQYSATNHCCQICDGPHGAFYQGCYVYRFESEVTAICRMYSLSSQVFKDKAHIGQLATLCHTVC